MICSVQCMRIFISIALVFFVTALVIRVIEARIEHRRTNRRLPHEEPVLPYFPGVVERKDEQ